MIDISGLVRTGEPSAELVRELTRVCEHFGFFALVGHDLPEAVVERFRAAQQRFFALPDAAKQSVARTAENARGYYDRELTKNTRDWKEIFDFGCEPGPDGTDQWPTELPGFRDSATAYFDACQKLALLLLRAVSASLGVGPDRLGEAFAKGHTSFLRLNYYPRCPEPGPLGVNRHTDAGVLTLLLHDEVPGLQFFLDGEWLSAEPLPGALLVNVGDMLQVWSNDRYHSPLHRVLVDDERVRYSAPFFLNPSESCVCSPLVEPALYRPVPWAEFRQLRAAGDYADLGEEVQISHYRCA